MKNLHRSKWLEGPKRYKCFKTNVGQNYITQFSPIHYLPENYILV